MPEFSTLGESSYVMRHYQDTAVEKTIEWLYEDGNPSGIILMATGTGKTAMAGELMRRCIERGHANRFLFFAHRDTLVKQAIDVFDASGLSPGREQGKLRADSLFPAQVVVSTIQTMSRRLKEWSRSEFDMIITDECHRAKGATYEMLYDHFDSAKLVGITATLGKRLDRFTDVIFKYNLEDAINDPIAPALSPIRLYRCDVGADLRGCSTRGKKGDFDQASLAAAIQPYIEMFANAIVDKIGSRKTIAFMPCVASATAMADALCQLGIRAKWVSGDHKDRRRIIQDYQDGAYQVIVNADMLGEGFDDRPTECVVLKPTRSWVAYAQMVGRATRLWPGKEYARIIDFNHTSDLDLIGPESLVDMPEDVAKAASDIMKKEKEVNLWEAVERAKVEVQKRQELKVQIAALRMQYRTVEVDPFQCARNLGTKIDMKTFGETATLPQVNLLKKFKVPNPEGMSKNQARRMIGQLMDRSKAGLCTLPQLNLLVSLGVKPHTARTMSFDEASRRIDSLMARRS